MRRRSLRRPLIRGAMEADAAREAVQLVLVVGKQVAPLAAMPIPDRVVDVNGHARLSLGEFELDAAIAAVGVLGRSGIEWLELAKTRRDQPLWRHALADQVLD